MRAVRWKSMRDLAAIPAILLGVICAGCQSPQMPLFEQDQYVGEELREIEKMFGTSSTKTYIKCGLKGLGRDECAMTRMSTRGYPMALQLEFDFGHRVAVFWLRQNGAKWIVFCDLLYDKELRF